MLHKKILLVFKLLRLRIEIASNMKRVYFLEVTLKLSLKTIFFNQPNPRLSRDFHKTDIQETTSNPPRGACIIIHTHTHTNNYIYDHTPKYANIIYTNIRISIKKKSYTQSLRKHSLTVFFDFFDFSKIFLFLIVV